MKRNVEITETMQIDEHITDHDALTTKLFFPSVVERLKIKIRITQNVAAMLTGHGKTRAYLHRFKIREDALCVCQTYIESIDFDRL